MDKNTDQFILKAAGMTFYVISRSNPVFIVILFYIILSFFACFFSLSFLWEVLTIILFIILVLLLIFKPNRLWSEKHSLEMRKLDLTSLGDKKNPQIKVSEYSQLYQPISSKIVRKKGN